MYLFYCKLCGQRNEFESEKAFEDYHKANNGDPCRFCVKMLKDYPDICNWTLGVLSRGLTNHSYNVKHPSNEYKPKKKD